MKSSPKLLVVGVKWPPETFIHRKLRALSERGFRVEVASPFPWYRKRPKPDGITVTRLPHGSDGRAFRRLIGWWHWARLAAASPQRLRGVRRATERVGPGRRASMVRLARVDADVIHFEWNSAAIDYLPMYEVWKVPITISCRGSQTNVRPLLEEEFADGLRASFRAASGVHCVSRAIQAEAGRYGLDPNKARVVTPAVDPDFFTPIGDRGSDDVIHIVTVGGLTWDKGYEYALAAVRNVVDRGVDLRYHVVGGGIEEQRVRFTVHDLGLEEVTQLHGQMGSEAIRDLLQRSDIFLLPSLSAGILNSVLEAMSTGLPTVSADAGGMREAVTHGEDGFLVPLRDVSATAEAVYMLATDPDLRARVGAAARERVARDFTLEQQAAKFESFYREVIGGRTG